MINKYSLTKDQAFYAINNNEFANEILISNKKVIIILTQDWCPQWIFMKRWIYNFEIEEDISVYELIYNKVDYFNEFMNFKERIWKNYEVPYLRYYINGKLVKETNYIGKENFINIVKNL